MPDTGESGWSRWSRSSLDDELTESLQSVPRRGREVLLAVQVLTLAAAFVLDLATFGTPTNNNCETPTPPLTPAELQQEVQLAAWVLIDLSAVLGVLLLLAFLRRLNGRSAYTTAYLLFFPALGAWYGSLQVLSAPCVVYPLSASAAESGVFCMGLASLAAFIALAFSMDTRNAELRRSAVAPPPSLEDRLHE